MMQKASLTSSVKVGMVNVSASARDLAGAQTNVYFTEKKRYCMICGQRMPVDARHATLRLRAASGATKGLPNCGAVIPIVAKFSGVVQASHSNARRTSPISFVFVFLFSHLQPHQKGRFSNTRGISSERLWPPHPLGDMTSHGTPLAPGPGRQRPHRRMLPGDHRYSCLPSLQRTSSARRWPRRHGHQTVLMGGATRKDGCHNRELAPKQK
jgi:hypothetical protein